jgi:hypothetical protein
MSGQLAITDSPSHKKVPARMGNTLFLAPCTEILPQSFLLPLTTILATKHTPQMNYNSYYAGIFILSRAFY